MFHKHYMVSAVSILEKIAAKCNLDVIWNCTNLMFMIMSKHGKLLSTLMALCVWNPLGTDGLHSEMASNVGLWYFLCWFFEQAAEQTLKFPLIWDEIMLTLCHVLIMFCRWVSSTMFAEIKVWLLPVFLFLILLTYLFPDMQELW